MPYHVFISYRRDGGDTMARLLYDRLKDDGYAPFLDIEQMRSGKFNEQLYDRIAECEDFLMILSPGALDRCKNKDDWVRLELQEALRLKKNIVPFILRDFEFPKPPRITLSRKAIPSDILELRYYQGVAASQDYFDSSLERLKQLFRYQPGQTVEAPWDSQVPELVPQQDFTPTLTASQLESLHTTSNLASERPKDNDSVHSQKLITKKRKSVWKLILKSAAVAFVVISLIVSIGLIIEFISYEWSVYQNEQLSVKCETLMADGKFDEAYTIYYNAGKYSRAKKVLSAKGEALLAEGKYDEAFDVFSSVNDHTRANDALLAKGEALLAEGKYDEAFDVFSSVNDHTRANDALLAKGESLLAEGKYDEAFDVFSTAENHICAQKALFAKGNALLSDGNLKDAIIAFECCPEVLEEDLSISLPSLYYEYAQQCLEQEHIGYACLYFMKAGDYQDSKQKMRELQKFLDGRISAGYYYTVGVNKDGTLLYAGAPGDFAETALTWQDVTYVASGYDEILGITSNGQLLYTDATVHIEQIGDYIGAAGGYHSFLSYTKEGTAFSYGSTYHHPIPTDWYNLVAADANWDSYIGLAKDGTIYTFSLFVVKERTAYEPGESEYRENIISYFNNVIDIAASKDFFLLLHADGTVTYLGNTSRAQEIVEKWNDIVAISASSLHAYGLKSDGTIVSTEYDYQKPYWTDIVAISSDKLHVVGLKADGTVVAHGRNDEGQCDVSDWNLLE